MCESIQVGKDQTHRFNCGLPLHPKWLPRPVTLGYQCVRHCQVKIKFLTEIVSIIQPSGILFVHIKT